MTVDARAETYPRVGGPCDHFSCLRLGQGCRAYADAALQPSDEDLEFGRRLVLEGWWSTSRRYCTIARWKEPVPTHAQIEEALTALAGAFQGHRLAEILRKHELYKIEHRATRDGDQEEAVITPTQMLAFKRAGGECGR